MSRNAMAKVNPGGPASQGDTLGVQAASSIEGRTGDTAQNLKGALTSGDDALGARCPPLYRASVPCQHSLILSFWFAQFFRHSSRRRTTRRRRRPTLPRAGGTRRPSPYLERRTLAIRHPPLCYGPTPGFGGSARGASFVL